MAEPLKELFNESFYRYFATQFKSVYKKFDDKAFVNDVTEGLFDLSLNQRLRNTSVILKRYIPENFEETVQIMHSVIQKAPKGYASLIFPDYIGLYGHANFAVSMDALKYFTQFGSSEFAIREFLKNDFHRTIKVMEKWSMDKNYHVRRLASEGSRPRLPWSFKLDQVIKDPALTSRILENLKNDKELYVKKSVANHLNDISKDNSRYMLSAISSWDLSNPHTKWIIKHANRTLIKKGDPDALKLFSFEKNVKIDILNFSIKKKKIVLGESLEFEFDIRSKKSTKQKLVVDYAIHYAKKGTERSVKIFKLKEIDLLPMSVMHISKKQLIKDFSTRKHYAGKHAVELLINGNSYGMIDFALHK